MDLGFMSGRTGYYEDSGTATNAGSGLDQATAAAPERGISDVITAVSVEREHMFDKVVTPSDVGKLNRLVIPKQHAERYFPLDSSANEKGLLLNFEDRNGKPWRFRYSYWNSSQSYVMTKGWSRFVKEKKLDAGDVISFQRGAGEAARDQLFIDWRRRPDAPEMLPPLPHQFSFQHHGTRIHPWSPLFLQPSARSYTHLVRPNETSVHHYHTAGAEYQNSAYMYGTSYPAGSLVYLTPAGGTVSKVLESMPVVPVPVPVTGKKEAKAKRLRLFGVTMDCPASDSDDCEIICLDSSPSSSMTIAHNSTPNGDPKGKSSMSLDLEM